MLAVRFAGPSDAETIHGFIRQLADYEREPHMVQCTPAELREQLAAERPPFECLIADEDGQPCGFALFFANYSTWRGRPGLYLEDLFVPPEHRGKGIGKRLLVEMARLCAARGCARLDWAVLDWNQPAIDFYRSLGAVPLAEWTTFRLTDESLAALARRDVVGS